MEKDTEQLITIIQRALSEDIGDGDVTTECTVPLGTVYKGKLIAKATGVIAGLDIAHLTFKLLDEQVQWEAYIEDGAQVEKGAIIATVIGQGRALLSAERVALNLLQRMSGIATLTRRFVTAVEGTSATILDTRKTVPGLRLLDKEAVALGGGQNHRFGLYDMVLIKENHIAAAGSISQAVSQVRAQDSRKRAIEVEVQNLTELRQALALNVDRIMLDNMSLEQMREAVQIVNGQIPLEASGNVSLQTVSQIAATGVDYISVGKLTHSVSALDISFILEPFVSL
ncbi:MAG: carboxylating nicotinate-nucleotide diphosphorylase [Ardenticatenaceae bacterium]